MKSKYIQAKDDDDNVEKKPNKCQKRLNFLYNTNTGELCGRTVKNWCKLLIFFACYYIVLFALFISMIHIFLSKFIPTTEPYRSGYNSLLTFTPGVNANPRSSIESGLIIADRNESNLLFTKYLSLVDKFFLKTFPSINGSSNGVNCTDNQTPKNITNFCLFDRRLLGPCADPKSELKEGRLCFYVRINKIYGWLPIITKPNLSNETFIHCEGQGKVDVNNLGKPIYYPGVSVANISYGIIQNIHFPFINQKDYASPTVAVQFPDMRKNLALMVQCSTLNMNNSFKATKFEIMIIDK